jgi:hypothetical protein
MVIKQLITLGGLFLSSTSLKTPAFAGRQGNYSFGYACVFCHAGEKSS